MYNGRNGDCIDEIYLVVYTVRIWERMAWFDAWVHGAFGGLIQC